MPAAIRHFSLARCKPCHLRTPLIPAESGPESEDLLWKDVDPELRAKTNFNVLLDLVNWKVTGDPYYYEHYHLTPIPIEITPEGEESWIFYGTSLAVRKR
jgi:hypothetical protein